MNKRLVDIKNELEEQELHAKIAEVKRHWGDDDQALAILSDAITELEKEAAAGSFGPHGLNGTQLISMGVVFTEDILQKLAEEAAAIAEAPVEAAVSEEVQAEDESESAEDSDETEETEESAELQEKQAAAYETAFALGAELGRLGLPAEELAKVASASDEEAEEFAMFLAQLSQELFSDEG